MVKLRALAILLTLLALVLASAQTILAGEGYATWYGQPYHGRRMANGQVFDMHDPTTTASNEFPFGTWLRVTNPSNGHTVEVQVRDRGGFHHALDLSYAAFAKLAPPGVSRIPVQYEVIPGPGQPPVAAPPPATPAPAVEPTVAPPEPTPAPATAAAEPAASAPTPSPSADSHVVQEGETLFAIAAGIGLSADELASWNGLANPNLVQVGQRLMLKPPAASALPAPPLALPSGDSYVVQEGDILWRIAEEYGVDPDALAGANGLGPDDLLRVGQELTIPNGATYYLVKEGDTLASIAEQFGTSVEALLRLNSLVDADHLAIDQRLRVR